MASRRARTRRTLAATTAAIAASGLVAASAASLGGINANDLGADVGTVASCDTDGVNVAWAPAPSYSVPATANYAVSGLDVTGINTACNGQNIKVTIANGTTSLEESTGLVAAGAFSASFTPVQAAEDITAVSIVIYE